MLSSKPIDSDQPDDPITVRDFADEDRSNLIELWKRCGLTRPWNDPDRDIEGFLAGGSSHIIVGELNGELLAGICVGHDGHRGWYYYLATDPDHRGKGFGRMLVHTAEDWLRSKGISKVQLLVRETNLGAKGFYARLGYQPNPCHIMQRWLEPTTSAPQIVTDRDDGRLESTVTFLEMPERPHLRPVHPPSRYTVALMRAQQPNVRFYRFLYNNIGMHWMWWERRVLADEALADIIQSEHVEIYVLYVDGVPGGYFELDRRAEPDIDLAYFGLMPDQIGKGLGQYLLYSAIETAWSYEPERLLVNTNTMDHPSALPLYQRMGFHPYKRERRVILDPRLTGVIDATA